MIVLLAMSSGCVNTVPAPIAQKSAAPREAATVHRAGSPRTPRDSTKPTSYVVKRGDTLYSIAWRFGIDFRNLSRWNRIANPNVIQVGQRLSLKAPPVKKSKVASATTAPKRSSKASDKPAGKSRLAPRRVKWSWPASGSIKASSSALGTKGIEILGTRGEPIKAASSGTVVYSGSGLRGYGQLIIVKHDEQFLSAYAHNDRLLVAEGATVKSGQRIADMGDSDAKRVMLHFEIRRNGKAVEPRDYLPRR
jgi:lipoprotein NlpD